MTAAATTSLVALALALGTSMLATRADDAAAGSVLEVAACRAGSAGCTAVTCRGLDAAAVRAADCGECELRPELGIADDAGECATEREVRPVAGPACDDVVVEESVPAPASAYAVPIPASAVPMPNASANAPTRPMQPA
ncbi:hypothetical protein BayCH28_11365 [Mycolicibacterium sp. CH28]|uniref:hypothetical protein n=1 Tax=Mycolicibacterium sp. CH28 TaxID=2512237 RepID=UPI0010812012|nr:hypothetical protein [Mycolicibacterium sp. CH28]TGD88343.1 hypothetical protein BayCH28_11365 [Mycolicibacterium sp. CH28]